MAGKANEVKKGQPYFMGSVFERPETNAVAHIFASGGEMGRLMQSIDWAQTPLGPTDLWPQSLRTALSICLSSRFPMLIWWGPQLVMLYNDAYRPMLGSTKHPKSMGQSGRECWPEIWDVIGSMLESVLQQGQSTWSDNQLLLLDRNGYIEECYFTFSYSPIRDESGGVGGVFTAVTETTPQVLSERRLRTLRELATHSNEATTAEDACKIAAEILATNPEDIPFALLYLLSNDGKYVRLAGSTGLRGGTSVSPFEVDVSAPEVENASWPLQSALQMQSAILVENIPERFGSLTSHLGVSSVHSALVLPVSRSGQEHLYGLLVAGITPRRALDDEYRGFFNLVALQVAASIAHVRAYQEERERAESLIALDRAKTTFFSNISHEFRTPLTLLLAPIEDMLADPALPFTQHERERLEIVRRNALRLLKLVNALLDFSRIESKRLQALYEPTDLARLTTDLASAFESAIEHAGMQLIIDCPPLPELIYVDRDMWEKIVLNLISNAFKFTLEGHIRVSLHQSDEHVELSVQDTGVGIAPADLPHIFERFYSVRIERARTLEGSGIGLSLVQELVRLHGGQVQVESAPDEGTTFTVSIPTGSAHLPADSIGALRMTPTFARTALTYVEEAARWSSNGGGTELSEWLDDVPAMLQDGQKPLSPSPNTSHARILLVDDNADMLDYLKSILEPYYEVETVINGREALHLAQAHTPDLVISDVMMPGLDGFQLLHTLRAEPQTRAIPVILVSARAGEESTVEGLKAGADDYLVKPFSSRELLTRVEARLEMARMRSGLVRKEREHALRLQQLAEAALKINSMLSLDDKLELITGYARAIIGAHQAVISLTLDQNWATAVIKTSLSEKYASWSNYQAPINRSGIYREVCSSNQPLRLTHEALLTHPSWQNFGKEYERHPPLRGLLAAPLIEREGRNIGVIQVSDKYEEEFTEEDEFILVQLAQIASVAIANTYLYQQAQESVQARDQLLSMVSHDLKNPLGAIKGYAQLLQRGLARNSTPDNDRTRMILSRIDSTVSRMTAQINELLDVTRRRIGQPIELVRREIDLLALARQVVAEQQQTTQRHRIHIETTLQQLPSSVDADRLARALSNLLSNAIKYTLEARDISVAIAREESDKGAWAIIAVRDQGIGIPEADLPHIFEQFRRAGNVAGKISGTGIGLASALYVVEMHGGTITVESKLNEGSTFTVRLPLDPLS